MMMKEKGMIQMMMEMIQMMRMKGMMVLLLRGNQTSVWKSHILEWTRGGVVRRLGGGGRG